MSKSKAIPQAIRAALAKEQGRAVRELRFERATVNTDARTVEICFATETPYERYWGVEILDCKQGSVRTQRLKSGCNQVIASQQAKKSPAYTGLIYSKGQ